LLPVGEHVLEQMCSVPPWYTIWMHRSLLFMQSLSIVQFWYERAVPLLPLPGKQICVVVPPLSVTHISPVLGHIALVAHD
jgi:hypothetical protein